MTKPLETPARHRILATSSDAGVISAAGLSAFALALYQVATPGSPEASYDSVLDWTREALFLAYLLASTAAITISRRLGWASKAAHLLISIGYGAIALGVVAGMVAREDPEWFFVVGGPGNLAAAIGFVVFAVHLRRKVRMPLWVALLCGIGGPLAVLMSEFGTSVLIGAFWLVMRGRTRDQV